MGKWSEIDNTASRVRLLVDVRELGWFDSLASGLLERRERAKARLSTRYNEKYGTSIFVFYGTMEYS